MSSTPEMITLEPIKGYPYTKDGDKAGKIRYRLLGQQVVNGKICQINGFITEISK